MSQARKTSLQGKLIDSPFDDYIILLPCLCVQDSPENPSPCLDQTKILIPKAYLQSEPIITKRSAQSGESLYQVELQPNAEVLLEETRVVSAKSVTDQVMRGSGFTLPDSDIIDIVKKILDSLKTPPTFPVPETPVPTINTTRSTSDPH